MRRTWMLLGLVLTFTVAWSAALAVESETLPSTTASSASDALILAGASDAVVDRDEDPSEFCISEGGPGWGGAVAPFGVTMQDVTANTPQTCCEACVANPACAQWSSAAGVCMLNIPEVNTCGPPGPPGNYASGQIRCSTAG